MRSIIVWSARVLAMAGILFVSAFALDVLGTGLPLPEIALALFIQLLPGLALAVILAITWRNEWLGGILFVLAGLSPFVLFSNPKWVNLMLGSPFLLSGLLFLTSNYMKPRGGPVDER